MAGHSKKDLKALIDELLRIGFTILQPRNGTYKIVPPDDIDGPSYHTHLTPTSLHPIVRDFKRLYGVDLTHISKKNRKAAKK